MLLPLFLILLVSISLFLCIVTPVDYFCSVDLGADYMMFPWNKWIYKKLHKPKPEAPILLGMNGSPVISYGGLIPLLNLHSAFIQNQPSYKYLDLSSEHADTVELSDYFVKINDSILDENKLTEFIEKHKCYKIFHVSDKELGIQAKLVLDLDAIPVYFEEVK